MLKRRPGWIAVTVMCSGWWLCVGVQAEEPSAEDLEAMALKNLPTVERALEFLQSDDTLLREQGLFELGMLQSQQHVSEVIAALADPRVEVRRAAVVALRLIQGQDAILPLEELVTTSTTVEVREQAIHELEALQARSALPVLLEAVKDRQILVRLAAIEAVGALQDPDALPTLVRALRHRNVRQRRAAALAMGELGPAAQSAVPQLIKRLRTDSDEYVRSGAAKALRAIGDERAITPCLLALYDQADHVRHEAFRLLENWAQPGMEPLLAPHLHRGRPHVRSYMAVILGRIGTDISLTLLETQRARETHEQVQEALETAIDAITHPS